MIIFFYYVNTINGEFMKIIVNISKIIVTVTILFVVSFILVALNPNYLNKKVCRINNQFILKYYLDIKNVDSIEIKSECDKIRLFVYMNDNIMKDNVNSIILQFVEKKKIYNDNDIVELLMKNNKLNCLVIIDQEEKIDIDFSA